MEGFLPMSSFGTEPKHTPTLIPRCGLCGLKDRCKSPKMKVSGKGKRKVLILGESPGCVSGDTLIETAYRDKTIYPKGIPIKDLVGKKDFYVYSFDVENQKMVLGLVKRVWLSGFKRVYKVTYEWKYAYGKKTVMLRDYITVTANHPFLLKKLQKKDPFKSKFRRKEVYFSIREGLTIGDSLQPFHRRDGAYQAVGAFAKDMTREGRWLLSQKVGRELTKEEDCHHLDGNKWNDTWNNLHLIKKDEHAKLHYEERGNPLDISNGRENHRKAMQSEEYKRNHSKLMKDKLAEPEARKKRIAQIQAQRKQTSETVKRKFATDPVYYWNYLQGRKGWAKNWTDATVLRKFKDKFPNEEPPLDNHKIIAVEYIGEQDVYDMEVEKYHNFAAHGIFLHNSQEDEQGKPFVGPAGQELQKVLRKIGVDLRQDCWIVNALRCRPPNNKIKDERSIEWCRPLTIQNIEELKPEIIIPLGTTAVKSIIGWVWKENPGGITRWAGYQIPSRQLNCWITPTYHPSFALRGNEHNGERRLLDLFFQRHLEAAFSLQGRPWGQVPRPERNVRVCLDMREASTAISLLTRQGRPLAFDFETDRGKPDARGSRILSCALSDGRAAIAYPWLGEAVGATRAFLEDATVPKIGWNARFEHRWVKRILGIDVQNWVFDGMLAAHAMDSRKGTKGLKFQSFVVLGADSYDDGLKKYMETENNNQENRLREVPLEKLLLYNGLDALYEAQIAKVQSKQLGIKL